MALPRRAEFALRHHVMRRVDEDDWMNLPEFYRELKGKLIASCQASDGDGSRDPALIARLAQAALAGGAVAIRVNGPEDIHAVRQITSAPIIGIQKATQVDGRVLIAPSLEDRPITVGSGHRFSRWGQHRRRHGIAEERAASVALPIAVENDADALALAEKHFGAGRALNHFVCMTFGTGVGGGCYIAGALKRGAHFFANALGRIVIQPEGLACTCGQRGCLEAYSNAAALLRYARYRLATAEEVIRAGDSGGVFAIKELARHLAIGCVCMVSCLIPRRLLSPAIWCKISGYALIEQLRPRVSSSSSAHASRHGGTATCKFLLARLATAEECWAPPLSQ